MGIDLLKKMGRAELLSHVGSVEQIGGIKEYKYCGGKMDGVRAIEINTGVLRFVVLPDRGMDIANCEFKGTPISWISKTGITSPAYYDKDGFTWLRGFTGGLVTTCGLKHIGAPAGENGLHGRIANTPAEKVCVDAFWDGDDYIMTVSGVMRESVVFGENLVLRRTITAKLFDDKFTLCDKVINEGLSEESAVLCYHCNFGYPLVDTTSKLVGIPDEYGHLTPPVPNLDEECISIDVEGDIKTVGIENGSLGAYITYKRDTLPEFLLWKKMAASDYVIGLEPRTTCSGGKNLIEGDKYVKLPPLGEFETALVFSFKDLCGE